MNNSYKKSKYQNHFRNFRIAPIDIDPEFAGVYNWHGCEHMYSCGMSLTKSGFYECPMAGAIDRVFEIGKYVKRLSEVSAHSLLSLCRYHCSLCYRGLDRDLNCNASAIGIFDLNITSRSWKELIAKKQQVKSDPTMISCF